MEITIIYSAMRTGSTSLCDYISKNNFFNMREIFNQGINKSLNKHQSIIIEKYGKDIKNVQEFTNKIINYNDKNKVFKIFNNHMFYYFNKNDIEMNKRFITYISSLPNINVKFIILKRDICKMYRSLKNAQINGDWTTKRTNKINFEINYNTDEFRKYKNELIKWYSNIEEIFNEKQINYEVIYFKNIVHLL